MDKRAGEFVDFRKQNKHYTAARSSEPNTFSSKEASYRPKNNNATTLSLEIVL